MSTVHSLVVVTLILLCGLPISKAKEAAGGNPSQFKAPQYSLFQQATEVVDLATWFPKDTLKPPAADCPWLIYFYDDGCGHCRSTAPSYIQLAREKGVDESSPILFGALNCAEFPSECVSNGVRDVPRFGLLLPEPRNKKESPSIDWMDNSEQGLHTVGGQLQAKWKAHSSQLKWSSRQTTRCRQLFQQYQSIKRGWRGEGTPVPSFTEEKLVFFNDIANAFFYTMYHEVPAAGISQPESLQSLLSFLGTVATYLPELNATPLLSHALTMQIFTPETWKEAVLRANIPFSGTPDRLKWFSCKGSSWRYRGFPCGMWLLYHTLVGNTDPQKVETLLIIKHYARDYFNCRPCREHFMRFTPDNRTAPALQLWRVHNIVNKFLANVAEGADPLVPKIQFPSPNDCPECRAEDGQFIESTVLAYLDARYNWKNILIQKIIIIETTAPPEPPQKNPDLLIYIPIVIVLVVVLCLVVRKKKKRHARFN